MTYRPKISVNPGDVYGFWTIVEELERVVYIYKSGAKKGRKNWLRQFKCRCICGNEKVVGFHNLRSGRSTSCSCHCTKVPPCSP